MYNLEKIKSEYQKVIEELKLIETSSNWEKQGKLKKEKEIYEKIIEKQKDLEEINKQSEEVEKILTTEKDIKLISLAQEEKQTLLDKKQTTENDLEKMLKGSDKENKGPKSI